MSAAGYALLEPKWMLRASVELDTAAQELKVYPEVFHDTPVIALEAGCQCPERRQHSARDPRSFFINHVRVQHDLQDWLSRVFATTFAGAWAVEGADSIVLHRLPLA
jgi:hypothetical protein